MTGEEANGLAIKFKKAWPKGPHQDIWAEELQDANVAQAEQAYRVIIRAEDQTAPSVGYFFHVYRGLITEREDDRLPNCGECGSTGWIQVTEKHKGHDYPSSKPCRCARGREREGSFRKIVTDNEALFDRLQPGRHLQPIEQADRGLDF